MFENFAQKGLLDTSCKSLPKVELACDFAISGRGGLCGLHAFSVPTGAGVTGLLIVGELMFPTVLPLPPLLVLPNSPVFPLLIDPFSFRMFVRPNEASKFFDRRFAFRLR
jgi:hypothetical protein